MTAPRSSPGPRLLSDEERARGDAMLRALRDMDAELTTDEQHEFAALANEAAEFILSLLTALSTAREAGERAQKDTERLDRLHHVMHHLRRGYDWNAGTPELTRAAIDLAWQQLPKMTRDALTTTEPAAHE